MAAARRGHLSSSVVSIATIVVFTAGTHHHASGSVRRRHKPGHGDKANTQRWAAAAAQAGADPAASATLDDGWKSYSKGIGPNKRHKMSSPGGTEYSKTAGQKKHDQRRLEADPAQTLLHTRRRVGIIC